MIKLNNPPESYQSISLLSLFSKILERIKLKRILLIIEANIPNTQFGFCHNHSSIYQVHRLVNKISYTLEKKLIYTAAFLDVAQAFDRVWHKLTSCSNLNPSFPHTYTFYLNLI